MKVDEMASCLFLSFVFCAISLTVAQRQVIPDGISAVNGSSTDMGCTGREQDGSHTLCNCSYLIDGVSPDINTSCSNWASQLVTVRWSKANANIIVPHVVLTFDFDTNVSVTGIEIDLFNCPDWNIGATSVVAYFSTQYDLSLDISSVSFAPSVSLPQLSCDSLSTVTFTSIPGNLFKTIFILVSLESPSMQWVHVGEVRFMGINISYCPQPPNIACSLITTTQLLQPTLSTNKPQSTPGMEDNEGNEVTTSSNAAGISHFLSSTTISTRGHAKFISTGRDDHREKINRHSDPSAVIVVSSVSLLLIVILSTVIMVQCLLIIRMRRSSNKTETYTETTNPITDTTTDVPVSHNEAYVLAKITTTPREEVTYELEK